MKSVTKSRSIHFVGLISLYSLAALGQWQEVSTIPPNIGDAIDAVNDLTAIVTANNSVYRTDDAGDSWIDISPDSGMIIVDVSMTDSLHIWICTSYPPTIQHSTDGGATWAVQYDARTSTDFFNYVEMFDSQNGIAMGDALTGQPALFLRTTDGGLNWISMNTTLIDKSSGDIWRHVDFVDANKGFFFASGGGTSSQMFKTTDGCATWNVTSHPENRVHALKFFDENIGISIYYSKYHLTRDGGATWQEFAKAESWGMDIEFHPEDPSKVWYCAGHNLYFSSDTGKTWASQLETNNPIDIVITDELKGWVLTRSSVYRTATTVGTRGDIQEPEQFSLYQNYPNPFNPSTTLRYGIPEEELVTLIVYDILGNVVRTFSAETKPAGWYNQVWGGLDDSGQPVPTGMYLTRLQAGSYSKVIKMLYLK